MPVTVRKLKSGKYKVSTQGGTKARSTSKKNAESQKRLLNAVEHGWKPTGIPSRKKK
jgi:hypothetical protein